MRAWPVHRPTHAPATSPQNKRQQRPPQNQKAHSVSFPSSRGQHTPRHQSNLQRKKTVVIPESPPQGGASHRSCGCAVAKRLHGRGGAGETPGEFFHTLSSARPAQRIKPSTLTPSCRHSVAACVSDHSRGQALAPATALSPNGNTPPSSFRNFHFAQAEGKYPESPPQGGHDSPLERMRSAASQDTARRRG